MGGYVLLILGWVSMSVVFTGDAAFDLFSNGRLNKMSGMKVGFESVFSL